MGRGGRRPLPSELDVVCCSGHRQALLPAGPLPSLFVQERSISLVPMTGIKGFRAQSHLRMESTSQDASGCLPRVQLQSRWPKAKARPLPTPTPSFAATTQLVSVQKPHSCRCVPEGPALSHQARLPVLTRQVTTRARLHGKALYGFPADLASRFQYPPKASHRCTPRTRVTICSSPDPDTLLS